MSPPDDTQDRHVITHPELSPEEGARHRGADPSRTLGPWPTNPPDTTDPDPNFQPAPDRLNQLMEQFNGLSKRHRPRREDVLPYEMIRAFAPGDRGARPTWPPTPCWESPDILLIDAAYTGPFDTGHLVGSPVSGRSYRVFVRVFNLGLLEGVGTHVRAWYVEPGFFSGQPGYEAHPIGGAYVDLEDRTRPGSHRVVEIDPPWAIPHTLTGHECLIAAVSCIADPWRGGLDTNQDRHLGQRNLAIAVGAEEVTPLVEHLGGMVPDGGGLEIMHGGGAVVPLLNGVVGGRLVGPDGPAVAERIVAPVLGAMRHGVPMDGGQHLLIAARHEAASVVVPTDVLAVATRPVDDRASPSERAEISSEGDNPFAQPGEGVRLLRGLDPRVLLKVALVGGTGDLAELLPRALRRMLDIGELRASTIAAALGGAKGAAHLLRFVATGENGGLIGGYSIVVA